MHSYLPWYVIVHCMSLLYTMKFEHMQHSNVTHLHKTSNDSPQKLQRMITLKACKHEIFKQERYGIFEFKCPTLIAMNILLENMRVLVIIIINSKRKEN